MTNYMYVVNDLVFENQDGKFNARKRAKAYCKSHGIDEGKLLEVRNDVELQYLKHIKKNGARWIGTHEKVLVHNSFNNIVGHYIPPVVADVPFHYVDDNGIHYEWLVSSIYNLTADLVNTKVMFDEFHYHDDYYLKLVYVDVDGTYKEFTLNELELIRDKYKKESHRKMLANLKELRERQTYDRLLKLRAEGRITESQTKTLYRLEERYGK